MAHFFIVRYPDSPIPVKVKGRLSIGRSENNDIVLTEARVSRNHALISWRESDKQFIVTDLGSSNGTFLNGSKITPSTEYPLQDWDKIRISSSVFTVRYTDKPEIIKSEFKELSERVHTQVTEIMPIVRLMQFDQPAALSGDLAHLCPIELFQMLETGAKTGSLVVKTELGEGHFNISKGMVVSASLNDLRNEMAVFEIINCTKGEFAFVPQLEITEPAEMSSNTTALLMECCRMLDENNKVIKQE